MASSLRSKGKRKRADYDEQEWSTLHHSYSSKLVDALRLVRAGGWAARGREVRAAADRALAAAARGRSRWSRAILARQKRRRFLRARIPFPPSMGSSSSTQQQHQHQNQQQHQIQLGKKAKVLRRLVPGCRKLPFPALLAEVSDYIAALEMQVRAMNAVAQALSAASSSSPS